MLQPLKENQISLLITKNIIGKTNIYKYFYSLVLREQNNVFVRESLFSDSEFCLTLMQTTSILIACYFFFKLN